MSKHFAQRLTDLYVARSTPEDLKSEPPRPPLPVSDDNFATADLNRAALFDFINDLQREWRRDTPRFLQNASEYHLGRWVSSATFAAISNASCDGKEILNAMVVGDCYIFAGNEGGPVRMITGAQRHGSNTTAAISVSSEGIDPQTIVQRLHGASILLEDSPLYVLLASDHIGNHFRLRFEQDEHAWAETIRSMSVPRDRTSTYWWLQDQVGIDGAEFPDDITVLLVRVSTGMGGDSWKQKLVPATSLPESPVPVPAVPMATAPILPDQATMFGIVQGLDALQEMLPKVIPLLEQTVPLLARASELAPVSPATGTIPSSSILEIGSLAPPEVNPSQPELPPVYDAQSPPSEPLVPTSPSGSSDPASDRTPARPPLRWLLPLWMMAGLQVFLVLALYFISTSHRNLVDTLKLDREKLIQETAAAQRAVQQAAQQAVAQSQSQRRQVEEPKPQITTIETRPPNQQVIACVVQMEKDPFFNSLKFSEGQQDLAKQIPDRLPPYKLLQLWADLFAAFKLRDRSNIIDLVVQPEALAELSSKEQGAIEAIRKQKGTQEELFRLAAELPCPVTRR